VPQLNLINTHSRPQVNKLQSALLSKTKWMQKPAPNPSPYSFRGSLCLRLGLACPRKAEGDKRYT